MPVTQLSDVVVPDQFTAYQIEQSCVRTAVFRAGFWRGMQ